MALEILRNGHLKTQLCRHTISPISPCSGSTPGIRKDARSLKSGFKSISSSQTSFWICRSFCCLGQGLPLPGHITSSKNFKTPYFKVPLVGNSNGSGTSLPNFFFFWKKIPKTKAASPILSCILFWWEIHFMCNYVLNIFREVESYIDLCLAKFWWSYLERYLNGILLTSSSLLK